MVERKVRFFDKPGEHNTLEALEIAKNYSKEIGIKNVVVASTRGTTAVKARDIFKDSGISLIIVTHAQGFLKPGEQQFDGNIRKELEGDGVKVLTTIHAFGGIDAAISKSIGGTTLVEMIARSLRMFSQGVKVAVEIVLMAADAGLIPVDQDVISVAGTGKGADTVLLIKPAHTRNIFDLKVREVLAMPRTRHSLLTKVRSFL
jgi:hypothetical protein